MVVVAEVGGGCYGQTDQSHLSQLCKFSMALPQWDTESEKKKEEQLG